MKLLNISTINNSSYHLPVDVCIGDDHGDARHQVLEQQAQCGVGHPITKLFLPLYTHDGGGGGAGKKKKKRREGRGGGRRERKGTEKNKKTGREEEL